MALAGFSSAQSLFLGLSLRIFIDTFLFQVQEPTMKDFGLLGIWQGVAVYYAYTINHELALAAALLVGARLILQFTNEHDLTRFVSTVVGVALGLALTDIFSRFIGDGIYARHTTSTTIKPHRSTATKKTPHTPIQHTPKPRHSPNHRTPKANGNRVTESIDTPIPDTSIPFRHRSPSDITSLDTTSDLIGANSSSLSPLDREVARLRARASLADTERRRYKEERKWAISQGNHIRAAQMTWEVKRYKALVQSFHREADDLLIRASKGSTELPRSGPPERSPQLKGPDSAPDRQPAPANGNSEVANHRKPKPVR